MKADTIILAYFNTVSVKVHPFFVNKRIKKEINQDCETEYWELNSIDFSIVESFITEIASPVYYS